MQLETYWLNDKFLRRHTDIHLLYDTRSTDSSMHGEVDNPQESLSFSNDLAFPVNVARNTARLHSNTDYVLYVDADFIPSEHLHDDVKDGKISSLIGGLDKNQRAVLVLPGYTTSSFEHVPRNRSDMLRTLHQENTTVSRINYSSQDFVDF